MFCYKCGSELSNDMLFCPKCGTKSILNQASEQIQDDPKNNHDIQDSAEGKLHKGQKKNIDLTKIEFLRKLRKNIICERDAVLVLDEDGNVLLAGQAVDKYKDIIKHWNNMIQICYNYQAITGVNSRGELLSTDTSLENILKEYKFKKISTNLKNTFGGITIDGCLVTIVDNKLQIHSMENVKDVVALVDEIVILLENGDVQSTGELNKVVSNWRGVTEIDGFDSGFNSVYALTSDGRVYDTDNISGKHDVLHPLPMLNNIIYRKDSNYYLEASGAWRKRDVYGAIIPTDYMDETIDVVSDFDGEILLSDCGMIEYYNESENVFDVNKYNDYQDIVAMFQVDFFQSEQEIKNGKRDTYLFVRDDGTIEYTGINHDFSSWRLFERANDYKPLELGEERRTKRINRENISGSGNAHSDQIEYVKRVSKIKKRLITGICNLVVALTEDGRVLVEGEIKEGYSIQTTHWRNIVEITQYLPNKKTPRDLVALDSEGKLWSTNNELQSKLDGFRLKEICASDCVVACKTFDNYLIVSFDGELYDLTYLGKIDKFVTAESCVVAITEQGTVIGTNPTINEIVQDWGEIAQLASDKRAIFATDKKGYLYSTKNYQERDAREPIGSVKGIVHIAPPMCLTNNGYWLKVEHNESGQLYYTLMWGDTENIVDMCYIPGGDLLIRKDGKTLTSEDGEYIDHVMNTSFLAVSLYDELNEGNDNFCAAFINQNGKIEMTGNKKPISFKGWQMFSDLYRFSPLVISPKTINDFVEKNKLESEKRAKMYECANQYINRKVWFNEKSSQFLDTISMYIFEEYDIEKFEKHFNNGQFTKTDIVTHESNSKLYEKVYAHIAKSIQENERIICYCDDGIIRRGKQGHFITNKGIHFYKEKGEWHQFVAYSDIKQLKVKSYGLEINGDNKLSFGLAMNKELLSVYVATVCVMAQKERTENIAIDFVSR